MEAVGVQDKQDVQSAQGIAEPDSAEPDPSSDAGGADSMLTGEFARRHFVLRALAGMGALIAALVAIPIAGFAAVPFFRAKTPPQLLPEMVPPTLRSEVWVSAGALDDYDIDEPQLVPLQREVTDGWVTATSTVVVYVTRLSGDRRRCVRHPLHPPWVPAVVQQRRRHLPVPLPRWVIRHRRSGDGRPAAGSHEPLRRARHGRHRRGRPPREGSLTMHRIGAWFDERLGIFALGRAFIDRKIPGNIGWWHTFGSATLVLLVVQVATGIALTMSYVPSPDHAYDSILYIDATPFGGLVRGIHHWAAGLLVLLIGLHILRVFTWGAYRYPRELAWVGGALLFFVVLGLRLHRVSPAMGPEGLLGDRGRHQHRRAPHHSSAGRSWSCCAAASSWARSP